MKRCALKTFLSQYLGNASSKKRAGLTYLALFLVSFSLVINYFIRPGTLVQGVDSIMWVAHADYYKSFNWIYSWYDRTSLGFVRIPTLLEIVMGVGDYVLRDPSWVYRGTLLLIIFMASLGSCLYIKYLTEDSIASFIGAFLYILNPWFLSEMMNGHIDILVGVGLFPWLLLALEKRKLFLMSFLACAFLTAAHPQAVYTFGVFFVAYLFVTIRPEKKDLTYLLAAFASATGLSAFYTVQFIFVNGFSGYAGLTSWTIEDVSPFIMPPWLALSSVALVLCLSVLILRYGKEYKHSKFLCVMAISTALLAASPSFPVVDNIYFWIFRNVPFFDIFRVPTRLMMATMFCIACMIGIVAGRMRRAVTKVKLPFRRRIVSMSKIYGTVLVGVIVTTSIISSWVTTAPLLGNYTPDSQWVSNYEWLRGQNSGEWNVYTLPVTSGWILTPYGATQDFGASSTLFSGKPVTGTPAKTAASYSFLKYLERIVQNNITDQWLKLLGTLNVKYITSGPEQDGQEGFLQRQEGLGKDSLVYADEKAKVYENPYWTPSLKVVSDVNLLAGGYSDIVSLMHLSLNLSDSALYFMKTQASESIANYSLLIYEDFTDYLMLTLDKGIRIPVYQFGSDHVEDPRDDWVKEDRWKIEGKFVLNDFTLSVSGEQATSIPFVARENGTYEIFVRMLSGPASERGCLSIGNVTVHPIWSVNGFKWYNLGETEVANGQNFLQIKNSGGRNDIDEIVLVKQNNLESHCVSVIKDFQNYTGRIIFNDEAYNIFNVTRPTGWSIAENQFDGDGHVLHALGGAQLSLELVTDRVEFDPAAITLPRSDNYTIVLRAKTSGSVVFNADDEVGVSAGNGEYSLHSFHMAPLRDGTCNIRISFSNEVLLDSVTIYSSSNSEESDRLFPNRQNGSRIMFANKASPTEYDLNVENNSSSCLVTSISYDDRWRAYVNGTEVSPVKMNDFLLSFPLTETGNLQVRVAFTPQKYVAIGFSITLASCFIILVVLTAAYVKTRSRRKKNANRRLLAVI
jgi:hypothetical protein